MKKGKLGATSLVVAVLSFLGLSVVAGFTLSSLAERSRLESRNDMERTMSFLLGSLRDHDDFGSAIESSARLKAKVVGVGIYERGGGRLYAWGAAPASFSYAAQATDPGEGAPGDPGREDRAYLEKPERDSIALLLLPMRGGPPPPPKAGGAAPAGSSPPPDVGPSPPGRSFMFDTLRKGEIVYLEIREPAYWRTRRLLAALFPIVEVLLAALIAFVRTLVVRNAEYRRRIEEQRNLVILGTAASTLAHEMKNPLLAIRLQTSILERTAPGSLREVGIINDEIDRLSALCFRVNDYLRDPAGEARPLEPGQIARETGTRLCGRDLLMPESRAESSRGRILIDPARLGSILENLLRNALESGSPEADISMEIGEADGRLWIDVLDRGRGVPKASRDRLFDPFFTTKSRGSGIGLSICKRFALAAKGEISIEDREGGGTRARVAFPLIQTDGAGKAEEGSHENTDRR